MSRAVPVLTLTRPMINVDSCSRLHHLTWKVSERALCRPVYCLHQPRRILTGPCSKAWWQDTSACQGTSGSSCLVAPQDFLLKLVSSFISQDLWLHNVEPQLSWNQELRLWYGRNTIHQPLNFPLYQAAQVGHMTLTVIVRYVQVLPCVISGLTLIWI